MPYVLVGVVLYLLYRHYAQPAAAPPAVVNLDDLPDGQPVAPSGGGGQAPQPAPAPPTGTVSWQSIPEGQQLTPGADYRASAPPQNMLVMAMVPGHLSGAGFTNVQIFKPGEAFPNDWPDTGNALRIAATLPPDAQPQTLNLDGVSVWRRTVTQTTGDVVRRVVHAALHPQQVARGVAHPTSLGVYAGLVRRP